jgi:hypothetical protein
VRLVESGVLWKGFGEDDLVEIADGFDFAFDFVAEFHLFSVGLVMIVLGDLFIL